MCQLVIPYNYTSYLVFCKSIIKDFDTIRHYLLFFFSLSLFISFFFTKHNPQNGKRETNYKRELKSLKTRDLRRGDTPQIEAPWTRSWTKFSNPIRDLVRWSTNRWKGEGTLPTTKARMSEFTAAMSPSYLVQYEITSDAQQEPLSTNMIEREPLILCPLASLTTQAATAELPFKEASQLTFKLTNPSRGRERPKRKTLQPARG